MLQYRYFQLSDLIYAKDSTIPSTHFRNIYWNMVTDYENPILAIDRVHDLYHLKNHLKSEGSFVLQISIQKSSKNV